MSGNASVAWLAVVCTDRGQHKRARLCDVRFDADGVWRTTECGGQLDDDGRSWEVLSPESDPEQWLYQFYCRRCGRSPRINRENWLRLIDGLHPRSWPDGALTRDLDVSLLPF